MQLYLFIAIASAIFAISVATIWYADLPGHVGNTTLLIMISMYILAIILYAYPNMTQAKKDLRV